MAQKGNAGIIFDFERPKAENNHWMNQPRDEHGDFINSAVFSFIFLLLIEYFPTTTRIIERILFFRY
jgi:hypothetical protein